MTRVLLVEDEHSYATHFQSVFGSDRADTFGSFEDLRNVVEERAGWDYAFVDFSLGEGSAYSGLSVLATLREHSPSTRLIGLTSLGERSRPLFAVAASQWFGLWAVMDKRAATQRGLEEVLRGFEPTVPEWRRKLREHGYLVNYLFQEPLWGALWKAALSTNCTPRGLAEAVPGISPSVARKNFIEKAAPAAVNFAAAFLSASQLSTTKPQLVLTDFLRENRTFFAAPDLIATLNLAKPWERCGLTV